MPYPLHKKISDLELYAPRYYTELPYHNYSHVLDSLTTFEALSDRLERHGVLLDRAVGKAALLMHDANYYEDHRFHGYKTKEEYSADLAHILLSNLNVRERDVEEVEATIISTTVSLEPKGNLQKAVRYADLGNVYGHSFPNFVKNFLLLQKEAIILGHPVAQTFEEQRDLSLEYLGGFIAPLTFEASDGSSVELPREFNFAERNFSRLGQMSVSTLTKIPGIDHLIPKRWLTSV